MERKLTCFVKKLRILIIIRVNLSSRRKPKLFMIKNLRNDVLVILLISRVLLRNFVLV
jgi:hypothetical protein